jgi:hypothetical protein
MLPIRNESIGLIILITSYLTSNYLTFLLSSKWIPLSLALFPGPCEATQLHMRYGRTYTSTAHEIHKSIAAPSGYINTRDRKVQPRCTSTNWAHSLVSCQSGRTSMSSTITAQQISHSVFLPRISLPIQTRILPPNNVVTHG